MIALALFILGLVIGYSWLLIDDYKTIKAIKQCYEKERLKMVDPDYWKAVKIVDGGDKYIVYNKFGDHIFDILGKDETILWEEKMKTLKKGWEDLFMYGETKYKL